MNTKQIVKLAGEICIVTPEKQNKWTDCAYVPWSIIHELRAEFAKAGIDLAPARAALKKRAKGGPR